MAGVIPWALTRWRFLAADQPWLLPVRVLGGALLVCGAVVVVQAFARFATEGRGTPAPVAPTARLVVGGLYRYVRNPMYCAVAATIIGQALLLGQPVLLGYAALFMAAVAAFVHFYEEPTLRARFGAAYETYRAHVPAWTPRPRPWTPPA
ncbi:isoprenylcysteine carboxyl methyltransferase [Pseudofrankia sp. EUN1h]|nr:isoprenylcysteine carboxyl methyltransferase [Pseudofrankia sp. EUN1h]